MTQERTIYERIFESVFLMTWRNAERRISEDTEPQVALRRLRDIAKGAAMVAHIAEEEAMAIRGHLPGKNEKEPKP